MRRGVFFFDLVFNGDLVKVVSLELFVDIFKFWIFLSLVFFLENGGFVSLGFFVEVLGLGFGFFYFYLFDKSFFCYL